MKPCSLIANFLILRDKNIQILIKNLKEEQPKINISTQNPSNIFKIRDISRVKDKEFIKVIPGFQCQQHILHITSYLIFVWGASLNAQIIASVNATKER